MGLCKSEPLKGSSSSSCTADLKLFVFTTGSMVAVVVVELSEVPITCVYSNYVMLHSILFNNIVFVAVAVVKFYFYFFFLFDCL